MQKRPVLPIGGGQSGGQSRLPPDCRALLSGGIVSYQSNEPIDDGTRHRWNRQGESVYFCGRICRGTSQPEAGAGWFLARCACCRACAAAGPFLRAGQAGSERDLLAPLGVRRPARRAGSRLPGNRGRRNPSCSPLARLRERTRMFHEMDEWAELSLQSGCAGGNRLIPE
jgi:hypothetical protein